MLPASSKDVAKAIEQAIYRLMSKLPYYGAMLQSFKISVTQAIPTAGVKFDDGGKAIWLGVNPTFFMGLTEPERDAVLIHEVSHVDRLHLIRIPQLGDWDKGNVAADLAINPYIPDLPECALTPAKFRLPDFRTTEYYYDNVKPNNGKGGGGKGGKGAEGEQTTGGALPNQQGEPNNGRGKGEPIEGCSGQPHDSHDWETSLSQDDQVDIMESTFKRALDKLGQSAGALPSHVTEALAALKALRTKNWHRELKRFAGRYINTQDIERTWSRRNRRYGLLEAGSKLGPGKKVFVAFDTSGSMSHKEIAQALAETLSMLKKGVQGTIALFDTDCYATFPLKRMSADEIAAALRQGGTNFVDVFKRGDASHSDAIIIFTDGDDCQPYPEKPRTPVLWCLTHGDRDKAWGYKTHVEITTS
jgi:predicted metal-dependent peptidase